MSTTITLIPGDGIGPSIVNAAVRVLEAAGAELLYDRQIAGMAAVHEVDNPLPPETLDSARRTGVILKGPLTTPVGSGFRSINVALRKEFDLYANVRPAVTLMPGGRYEDIDLVLIRENTEGLYVGVEHYIGVEGDPKAAAESVMIITRFGAERIVRYAFDYAVANERKKVTFAHKANILKYTQGLFLDVGREMAREYEGRVEFEDRIMGLLPPEQRAVVELTYYFGCSYEEIAVIAGCPENTVKTRMFHARAKLRKDVARINTERGLAIDTFYIENADKDALADNERLEELRSNIGRIIAPPGEVQDGLLALRAAKQAAAAAPVDFAFLAHDVAAADGAFALQASRLMPGLAMPSRERP